MNTNSLTTTQLEILKLFTVAWLRAYSFFPPEEMLRLYLTIHRIAERFAIQQRIIQNITIAQAPTFDLYTQQLQQIQAETIMRNRL